MSMGLLRLGTDLFVDKFRLLALRFEFQRTRTKRSFRDRRTARPVLKQLQMFLLADPSIRADSILSELHHAISFVRKLSRIRGAFDRNLKQTYDSRILNVYKKPLVLLQCV